MTGPTPLTAAEIQAHPEYPHITWALKPEKKGKVAVASGRGGPINISYEVHGRGDIQLVWVMGLGSFKSAWQRQTKDFAHTQGDKYTALVFDNRGMGESDKPLQRYSTSDMALDTIELLDHIGWTQERKIHFVGISMGGMICQEIAMRIPERIASLSLVSTAPRLVNTVGFFENLYNRISLFIPRPIDTQLTRAKYNLFSTPWLSQPDTLEHVHTPFPTNGDRVMASEISKRHSPHLFSPRGFIPQAIAAGWHHKSDEQLRELAEQVGRERIMVVHGDADRMITFAHAGMLVRGLGDGVETHFVEGQGHVLPIEMRETFNAWVEGIVERGERLSGR